MDIIFISHGGPGTILKGKDKETIEYWKGIGDRLKKQINGVLCVSAHWFGSDVLLINDNASIIYDFGEFYRGIYDVKYSFTVPDSEAVDDLIQILAKHGRNAKSAGRGLDHGAWIPLKYMFPDGKMPILQLQLPDTGDFDIYTRIGEAAREYAVKHNYAIVASGGITHKLNDAFSRMKKGINLPPEEWSISFLREITHLITAKPNLKGRQFMDIARSIPHFTKNHPTLDHFLPLLIALGARGSGEVVLKNEFWSLGMSLAAYEFQHP